MLASHKRRPQAVVAAVKGRSPNEAFRDLIRCIEISAVI